MNNVKTLPYALQGNEMMRALALLAARAASADIAALNIYGTIDAMPEQLLDALAYDFKIDWWDADSDIAAKRAALKSCFKVHRTLGTVNAVETAAADAFSDAAVVEWSDYGGDPFHYKLAMSLGAATGTEEALRGILSRARYYTNVRSVLDAVEFSTVRTRNLFCGCALMEGVTASYTVDMPEDLVVYLADDNGELLTDEDGNLLKP